MSDVSTAVSTAEYARIYEEQQPRLVAYARSLTRNAHTAEDLVAEAHFRVWRRLAAGHGIDNVPAYLMTTVRHLASAAGSAVRETPQDPQAGEQAEAGRHGDDPAEHVSSVDMVVRVLGQLPERWVKALWLAEAEGQPLAAIGPRLGPRRAPPPYCCIGRGKGCGWRFCGRRPVRPTIPRARCTGLVCLPMYGVPPPPGSPSGCSGMWTRATTAGRGWRR